MRRFLVALLLSSVASNGVVGSIDELPEDCAACARGSCRSVSGLYTKPDLPQGYSPIAQIPRGACRIVVQQLKHTKNNIALRSANGTYLVNGEWRFGTSRSFEAAGARFTYRRQDSGSTETISTSGPINSPLEIMIASQQANLGVKYGYSVPPEPEDKREQIAPPFLKRPEAGAAPPEPRRLDPSASGSGQRDEAYSGERRRLRRRFIWKVSGVTPCSKTCGGGVQTTTFACVREHTQTQVSEKRCSHLEAPQTPQIRCNPQACGAHWVGVWGTCAGSSCDRASQSFVHYCQQANPAGQMAILPDLACGEAKPRGSSRPCRLASCDSDDNEVQQETREDPKLASGDDWIVGIWTQCSASCGTGQRTRPVTCPSGKCDRDKRPAHAEYCDGGTCSSHGRHTTPWLVSDWSQCSEPCGTGTQNRLAACSQDNCEESGKPETARACSSERRCVGTWFAGPWGPCPESCTGTPKQSREIVCIVKVRGQSRIVGEITCPAQEKPVAERSCHGLCPPRWFYGEWADCEGGCPGRSQWREVRCRDANGFGSDACVEADRPVSKRACGCERQQDAVNQPAQDEPQDPKCQDKITNCYLAVQARLCHYPYYTDNCCASCSKSPQQIVA